MTFSPQTTGTIQRPDLGMALAEYDAGAQMARYVGHRILTVQPVMESAGNIGLWEMAQLSKTVENIERAEGAAYAETNYKLTQYSYATKEYGVAVPVDERIKQRLKYIHGGNDAVFDLAAAQLARRIVLEKAEQRIMEACDLGYSAIATFTESAITTDWTQHSSATPAENLRAGIELVIAACGEKPNVLALSGKAFRHLIMCEELLKELRSASLIAADKSAVTPQIVAAFLGLDEVVVSEAQRNTAAETSAASFSYMMNTDRALLFRRAAAMTPGLPMGAPGIGRVLHWSADGSAIGGTVEEWIDPEIRGKKIRVRHDVDELIEIPECGLVFSGVLT